VNEGAPPRRSAPRGAVQRRADPAAALADAQAIRQAGSDVLSLALMDARNRTLAVVAKQVTPATLGLAVRAAWFFEHWISGNLQRQRGPACDTTAPRLAGIEPRVAQWLEMADGADGADGAGVVAGAGQPEGGQAAVGAGPHPGTLAGEAPAIRAYLAATLELTLDLLTLTPEDDEGLYLFRLALQHEDRISEAMIVGLGLQPAAAAPGREPLWLPAQRFMLGSELGGYVPHAERWAHEVKLPEFEIDAQAVSWAQYAEFAEDGGYDRRDCWSDAGWAWLQANGRRAPRHVEQMVGAVLIQRGSALHRANPVQAAQHVSRHEAQAWCAWAGRRLPTEPEWELAASVAARRGFVWGQVFEWVAGSARLWPQAGPVPAGTLDSVGNGLGTGLGTGVGTGAMAEPRGVLRGAVPATPARWHHPRARRFAEPGFDEWPTGFRSCAI
jgi:gamma-glutamyl hercynylcysteine S-oxide synthase